MPRSTPLLAWVVDDQVAGAVENAIAGEYPEWLLNLKVFGTATEAVNSLANATTLPEIAVIDLNYNEHDDRPLIEEFEDEHPQHQSRGKNIVGVQVLTKLHEKWKELFHNEEYPRYCLYTANPDAKQIVGHWVQKPSDRYDLRKKDSWTAADVFELIEEYIWQRTSLSPREIALCLSIRETTDKLLKTTYTEERNQTEKELLQAATQLSKGLIAYKVAHPNTDTGKFPTVQLTCGSPARVYSVIAGNYAGDFLDASEYQSLGLADEYQTLNDLACQWNATMKGIEAQLAALEAQDPEEGGLPLTPAQCVQWHQDELRAMPVVGRWLWRGQWHLYAKEIMATTERALFALAPAGIQDFGWGLMLAIKTIPGSTQCPEPKTVLAAALHSAQSFQLMNGEIVSLDGTTAGAIIKNSIRELSLPDDTRNRLSLVADAIANVPWSNRGAAFHGKNPTGTEYYKDWLRPWEDLKTAENDRPWLSIEIDQQLSSSLFLTDWNGFFLGKGCFLEKLYNSFDPPQPSLKVCVAPDRQKTEEIIVEITATLEQPLNDLPGGGILSALMQLAGWGMAECETAVSQDEGCKLYRGKIEFAGLTFEPADEDGPNSQHYLRVMWRIKDYCKGRCP